MHTPSRSIHAFKHGLGAAAVAMLMLTTQAWAQPGPGGMPPFLVAGPHAEQRAERMLKRIDATDEQRQAVRQVLAQAREQHKPLMDEGRALRDEAMNLWTQPELDAAAMDQLRMRMNAHHQRMTELNSRLFLDVGRILTPEQRRQLAKALQERQERRH